MRATLSTTTFDPAGYVELDLLPASAFQDRRRRTNRVATLDGGAAFNEYGFVEADKTFTLRWVVRDMDTEDAVDMLARQYSRVRLSIDRAVYLCAIQNFVPGDKESELVLLVAERLTD